jgi:hypothetical protein
LYLFLQLKFLISLNKKILEFYLALGFISSSNDDAEMPNYSTFLIKAHQVC